MWNVGTAQNCSVSQDLGRFSNLQWIPIVLVISEFDPVVNSLFEIPDCCIEWFIHLLLTYTIFFFVAASKFFNFLATVLRSIPGVTRFFISNSLHKCKSLTLSLICPLIGVPVVDNLLRFKLSLRLNHTIPNCLRSKCWISVVVLSVCFLWADCFYQEQLWWVSSFQVFSEISFIRIEFSVSLKRMTPDTVPSTFPWHRLCNTDHRTFSFLSLCLATVSRGMLSWLSLWRANSPWETCETEVSNIVGTPNSPVFSRVIFGEVRDAIVVRIVDGRRVTVYRSDLVELLGLITCGVRGIGQVAKLLGARAEVR